MDYKIKLPFSAIFNFFKQVNKAQKKLEDFF